MGVSLLCILPRELPLLSLASAIPRVKICQLGDEEYNKATFLILPAFGSRAELVNGFLTVDTFNHNNFLPASCWIVHTSEFHKGNVPYSDIHNTFTRSKRE